MRGGPLLELLKTNQANKSVLFKPVRQRVNQGVKGQHADVSPNLKNSKQLISQPTQHTYRADPRDPNVS